MNIKSLKKGEFVKLPTEAWFKLDRIERFDEEDPSSTSVVIELYMGFELKEGTEAEELLAREYNPPLILEGDLDDKTGEITDLRYYDFSKYEGPVAT